MSAVGGSAGGGVLAFVPEGRKGDRTLATASCIADQRDSWLTVAVPVRPAWSALGRLESVEQWPELMEAVAHQHLVCRLDEIDRSRVCGLVVRVPVASSLLRRIQCSHHDLVVVPAGLGHELLGLPTRPEEASPLGSAPAPVAAQ